MDKKKAPFQLPERVNPSNEGAARLTSPHMTLDYQQICKKAAQKQAATSKRAGKSAEKEYENKMRCVQHEKMANTQTVYDIPLHKTSQSSIERSSCTDMTWSPGTYVRVLSDFTVGNSSFGGEGYIINSYKVGRETFVSVKYEDYSATKSERDIAVHRLTEITLPIHGSQLQPSKGSLLRQRSNPVKTGTDLLHNHPFYSLRLTFIEKLKMAAKSKLKRGWRKTELGFNDDGPCRNLVPFAIKKIA